MGFALHFYKMREAAEEVHSVMPGKNDNARCMESRPVVPAG